jgi:hypothetical protein
MAMAKVAMVNDEHTGNREADFSFGVREMRIRDQVQLALEAESRKPKYDGGGFDPYNTSGGFDRKQNWARVGKR